MFCSNCGARVDKGNFCSQCGTPVKRPDTPALPEGIQIDANGVIRWTWPERGYTVHFYMDGERVGMTVVHKEKEDTVSSAFKSFIKSGLELAATDIVTSSDAYAGQDLPWDSTGGGNSTYLTFQYIKKIKQNPKKSEILLKESISSMSLCMTAQQYPFILDHVLRHAVSATVK